MAEPDEVETSTATGEGGGEASAESPFDVLRWIYPTSGKATLLGDAPVTIGRDAGCTIHLDSTQVSRRHAEITTVQGIHTADDLGSKNGIFVNGERSKRARLGPGDVLRVGEWVAMVERVGTPGDLPGFESLGEGISGGAAMRRVVQRAKKAAAGALNVLLLGETGTGKDRLARAIHAFSKRPGPFLAVNCASYAESAASAELFGYRQGALSERERASVGHVRAADRGTLLLDEVPELPRELQAQLLRAIEQREVLPLGDTEPVRVDVLFIAASQVPLSDAVETGDFRADLRARLEGMVVTLPPLRERRADIVPLFLELLGVHGNAERPALEPKVVETLTLYDWPMNVRELENVVRRLVALHGARPKLGAEHLAEAMDESKGAGGLDRARRRSVPAYPDDQLEALLAAIDRHQGNLSKAADELNITRPKAYRMLRAAKARR
jgi:transcriptional regulator with PAS, ATPase and Fis domain